MNNLVSKTLRRSLLAGDVVYELQKDGPYEVAVRVHGLEDVNLKKEMHRNACQEGEPLEFRGRCCHFLGLHADRYIYIQ